MKQSTYKRLWVALVDCATPRALFLKKHQPAAGDDVAQDSALFVAGIPFKLREGLQQLFSQFGPVDKVCESAFHERCQAVHCPKFVHREANIDCRYNYTPGRLQL